MNRKQIMKRAHEIRRIAATKYDAVDFGSCLSMAWAEHRQSLRLRSVNFRQLLDARGITLADFVAAIDAGKREARRWEEYFWGRGECPKVSHFDFLERSVKRHAA